MPNPIEQPRFELQTRAAVRANSLDLKARTVEVVVSRGGGRHTYVPKIGRAYERLEISERAVDLERLRTAGPVLDGHSGWSTRSMVGSVRDAWIQKEDGQPVLVARLHFRETDDAEEMLRGIASGDVRNVSVGYRVHEWQRTSEPEADVAEVLAVRWEPWEVSFTPLPAEALAGVRSAEHDDAGGFLSNRNGHEATPMEEENENGGGGEAPAAGEQTPTQTRSDEPQGGAPAPERQPAPAPQELEQRSTDDEALLRRGGELERARIAGIGELCTRFGLAGGELEQTLVRDGVSTDDARVRVLEHLAQRQEPQARSGALSVGETEGTKMARSLELALEDRLGLGEGELTDDGARAMRHRSLLDMGRELLTRQNVQVRQHPADAAIDLLSYRSAHSSSDFPGVLANVANNSLRRAYGETPGRWRAFGRAGQVSDFKEARRSQLGAIGTAVKKPEGGSIQFRSMADAFERIRAETYALGFEVTRETLINDDLDAFSRTVPHMGRSASRVIDVAAFTLLVSNPTMEDGNALFSAAHSNIVDVAPLDVAGFQKAYNALRAQTGLGGADDILDLMPNGVLVPTSLTGAAHQLLVESVVADSVANVNPWGKMISAEMVLDSPRLTSSDFWYLMADQNMVDILEVAFLQGREMPQIEQERDFGTKGVRFSMLHDFGMAFLDHRGIVRAKVTAA